MIKININKNQFSDFINLRNNVFYPLKNFVRKDQFLEIIYKSELNKKFFPFPIFFGIDKKTFFKVRNKASLDIYYNKKYLTNIYNIKFYDLDKSKICRKIYGKNFYKHPFYKKFNKENYKFLSFALKKAKIKNFSHKYFMSPKDFKKKFKIRPSSKLSSFHTRNVPHKAHQWIHSYLFKKFGSLLIQPLIGQYKKGEYSDDLIYKSNVIAANAFKSRKVFSIPFFSYPRYAGFREAALHALVRKNYGCSHFWVGRDHAGYKNFYGYYQSQKFCYKNQSKLKIRIVAGKEPFYCQNCKQIKNKKCLKKNCSKSKKVKISGSKIRSLLVKNRLIPNYLMDRNISKLIRRKSLIS